MPERPKRPSYDVFISYDPRDAGIAQELAQRATTDGFRVWLDAWELVPGAAVTSEVEQAVADSLVFAACIGIHGADRLQTELALARGDLQPSRIVAILLPGGEVPPELAGRPIVDVRQGVSREAMDRLAQEISAARTEPSAGSGTTSPGEGPVLNRVDYRAVLVHLDQVTAEDPSNADAIRARAFALMALGRNEEAAAALDRLAELTPDDLMLITTRIPLLVSLHRHDEVLALIRSAEASADRIVAHIAQMMAGKPEAEVAGETETLSGLVDLTDRYSAHRLVDAVRTDRARAARIVLGELAWLEGRAMADAGDPAAALAAWQRAAALDPDRTAYRLQLVQALGGAGQLEELDHQLTEWTTGPDDRIALLARAWSALRREQFEEALVHLDGAIALDPRDPVPRAMRADLLIGTRRVAKSVGDLRALWENNPSNWQMLSRLLAVYRMLGQLGDEADLLDAWADRAEPFMRGIIRSPASGPGAGDAPWRQNMDRLLASGEIAAQFRARAETLRIQARWKDGDHADALRLARRALARWPRQYSAWATAIDLIDRPERAAAPEEPAPAGEPAWIESAWQAVLAFATNQRDRASALMQGLVRDAPEVGIVHWLNGVLLAASDALEAALPPLARAIELDPDAPGPLFSRADVLRRLGRLEEALADLDVALDDLQAGTESDAYFSRGEVRRMLGRYRQAIEDFDRALKMPARGPQLPTVIIGSRGQARLGLGDLDGALQDLNGALERDPTLVWALISRATAHLAKRDVDSAVDDRRRVVELLTSDPDAWAAYGMMLVETKQHETLWSALSEAASSHPVLLESPGIRGLLAQAAIATGRFAEAEGHFHASAELQPTEDFWRYEEARAMRHQGRVDDARRLVERTLEQQVIPPAGEPGHVGGRSNRCLYLLAAGREAEAEDEWRRLLQSVQDPVQLRTQLEELDGLDASGLPSPSLPRIRSSVQARLEELSSALVS